MASRRLKKSDQVPKTLLQLVVNALNFNFLMFKLKDGSDLLQTLEFADRFFLDNLAFLGDSNFQRLMQLLDNGLA